MTYTNNPNGEIYQAVEPERHPLRWLWWLLAAAILAALVWSIAWACTRTPAEVVEPVEPVAPIATIEPGEAPPVTEPILPEQISFAEASLEQFRAELDGAGELDGTLSAQIDDDHLYSGFQRLCADHLNGGSTLPNDVATAFGLGTVTEAQAEELNHIITANPALCLLR